MSLLKEGRKSCRAKWYVGTCNGDMMMYSGDFAP